ncbi:hemoglobin heart muscle subunit alpha-type-like [Bufo gargarizans]|uniref:hemoglobin heart muscle subunit alpha-type-like n=1 Tax=Bufo gargarizans TaxID=30331 RepID=UPI001CF4E65F|nr:hemoglobin heart muscle subunit alpha-type-like [Bufo gargarizans]
MGLSDSEKAAITSLWEKIAPEANKLGAESLSRLFQNHPETKSFFSHLDLTPGSQDLLTHGGKIFNAIGEASKNLDSLSKYQDLHTNKLKVNMDHMKLVNVCIQDVLSAHFSGDFVQAAWEKFLKEVSGILTSS